MNDRKLFDARKRYFIYGAGDVAREVLFCLQSAPRNLNIEAFIVSESCAGKSRMVDGIPVISFDDFKYSDDTRIIVAVLEKYRDEICTKLHSIGIQNPILMTFESDLWCEERGKTYALYRQEREKSPIFCCRMGYLIIYQKSENENHCKSILQKVIWINLLRKTSEVIHGRKIFRLEQH